MNLSEFRGKRILIMGLGLHGGGTGAAAFFARLGGRVVVTDLKTKKDLAPSIAKLKRFKNITYHLGGHRAPDFRAADYIIKNPGVRRDSPFLKLAEKYGGRVTSDIGIFFQMCPASIIGITGTRGKSTTAYLIWKFLSRGLGRRIFIGGNIRKSILEFLMRLKGRDIVVLELSSFQLYDLHRIKKSPQYAVITNILRDHLDWHESQSQYIKAKSAIFRYQSRDQCLFVNPDDRVLKKIAAKSRSRVIGPRLQKKFIPIVDRNLGAHYRSSVALAVAVAKHFQVSLTVIEKIIRQFTGLGSRQELIRAWNGIRFINDTTATSPDASVAAIKRFRPMAKGVRLILIAGGRDKNLDFDPMADEIRKSVDALILLPGTATDRLKKILASKPSGLFTAEASSMPGAVEKARKLAGRGDYVILSPGAASFGLFKHEFDRGEKFIQAVKKLKS